MSDTYGINEGISRFEIMDLWTDEEREKLESDREEKREKLQSDREEAGCCEYCGSKNNPHWVPSMTRYHWDKYKKLEDPNRDLFYCDECEEYHMEYWNNMWEEYSASRW